MKYVALLRGINVGGNAVIKMADLKAAVEKAGYTNVFTYIQSGNVVFSSPEKDPEMIRVKIERIVGETFGIESRAVVCSHKAMKRVVDEAPFLWKRKNDLRCYVAFIRKPVTPKAAALEVPIREGVDTLDVGSGVLYMSTILEGLTKSGFSKIVGKKIYKDMTIRNYNTVQKILALMEK